MVLLYRDSVDGEVEVIHLNFNEVCIVRNNKNKLFGDSLIQIFKFVLAIIMLSMYTMTKWSRKC